MQDDVRAHLERLAAELKRREWTTEFRSDGRWLAVINPNAPELQERVGCRHLAGGWEFHWAGGGPAGPAEDIADTADRIVHVLRTVGANGPVSEFMSAAPRLRRRAASNLARTSLSELAAELELRGWQASFRGDGLRLLVVNPAVGELRDLIGCRETADGGWEFCWSWGDPIVPADQLVEAANRIQLVLRSTGVTPGVS
jgi:hypothetical protein